MKRDSCNHQWRLSQLTIDNLNDDDQIVFVPVKDIRAFESIYNKMTQAKQEFINMMDEIQMFRV